MHYKHLSKEFILSCTEKTWISFIYSSDEICRIRIWKWLNCVIVACKGVIVACMGTNVNPVQSHIFFSLSVFDGTEVLIVYIFLWRPSEDSLQWSAIPDGSRPSKDWQSTIGWGNYWIRTQDWSITIWCRYQWATTAPLSALNCHIWLIPTLSRHSWKHSLVTHPLCYTAPSPKRMYICIFSQRQQPSNYILVSRILQ